MDDARYYLRVSNAHFMILGNFKKRILNGKEHHIINLNGLVTHKPLPKEIQKLLSFEFKELFPRKLLIPFENDLLTFEFTSELITIVSKYIISLAALLSGDINYCQQLLENVHETSKQIKSNLPSINQIRKRIPNRLLDIYLAQIRILMLAWRNSREIRLMSEIKVYLDKIEFFFSNEYNARIIRAIYYFVTDDINSAKNEIRKCRNDPDQVWKLCFLARL